MPFDVNKSGLWNMTEQLLDLAQEEPAGDYNTFEVYKICYNELPYSGKTPELYEQFIKRLSEALKI
jgi:hypothetical protein